MKTRISFHIEYAAIKTNYYDNNSIPIPKQGDTLLLKGSDIDYYLSGSNENDNIFSYQLYQFTIKSIEYLYDEEFIYIYVNLLHNNNIKDKSYSV